MNTIRELTAGARNVIGGNLVGVDLEGESSSTTVEGNYIGTTADGSAELSNLTGWSNEVGVNVVTSSNNLIGGTASGAGNVISGNGYGVLIEGTGLDNTVVPSANNLIQGNLIGTNALGTAPVPNILYGINLFQDIATTVGGTAAGAGNVISGNNATGFALLHGVTPLNTAGSGIHVGLGTHGDLIEGNKIGTDITGTYAIPNAGYGVAVKFGDATVTGNQISGNTNAGVYVEGDAVDVSNRGVWTGDDTVSDGFSGTPEVLDGRAPGCAPASPETPSPSMASAERALTS